MSFLEYMLEKEKHPRVLDDEQIQEAVERNANPKYYRTGPRACKMYQSYWHGEGMVGDVVVKGICALCGWEPDSHENFQRNLSFQEDMISLNAAIETLESCQE